MPEVSRAGSPGATGIWRYASRFEVDVPIAERLTLGEGGTPCQDQPGLAAELGLERLWLKREDRNPTGSHKDRGAAFQLSVRAGELRHHPRRPPWVVISSSGNAAIAAAAYAAKTPLRLAVFVAPGTPPARLRRILDHGARVIVSRHAISLCEAFARRYKLPNLRPSTDPLAVLGFMSLGWELCETPVGADSVFTFASSGASLVAIGRAVERMAVQADAGGQRGTSEAAGAAWPFQLHVVQGTFAHPIAAHFDRREVVTGIGAVGARGARKTRRVGEAVRLVTRSGGSGWIVTDSEARSASALLDAHGIHVALESAAALAAARRAVAAGAVRRAIVILTGARRAPIEPPEGRQSDDGGSRPPDLDVSAIDFHPRLTSAESIEEVEAALGWPT